MHGSERIVSLLASATEILACLGLLEQIKAVSHECDYPAEVADKPKVTRSRLSRSLSSQAIDDAVRQQLAAGQSLYQLDEEEICRIEPDLIVTQAQCDVCAVEYQAVMALVESHSSLAETTVLALNPSTLDEILEDIVRVGQVVGRVDESKRLVASLRERMKAIQVKLAGQPRVRVACIEWTEPIMLAGNWIPDLISMAGGQSQLAEAGVHSTYGSWQDIVELDPEVIVVAPCGFDLQRSQQEAEALPAWDHWDQLSAVRDERVFVMDGNALLNRSGPRVVETIEVLAHLFHPQHVAPPEGDSRQGIAWDLL
jgi:iron complex transport system substrate-binding protein